jgi:Protein of unknown function (DUF3800)
MELIMYILYVDESGDPGKYSQYSSKHFILSGLIVSFEEWPNNLERLKIFIKMLKDNFGLLLKTEIHASELIRINKIEAYKRIKKKNRLEILKLTSLEIPRIFSNSKIINICINKEEHQDREEFQTFAWSRMIQRYDTFLKKKDSNKKGIMISDDTNEPLVRSLLRKMRIYNPVPSRYSEPRNIPTNNIIEDVILRDSGNSYFIQSIDTIVHLLYRKEYPKGSLRKHRIDKLFDNFEPILLKEASSSDPLGIVRQ